MNDQNANITVWAEKLQHLQVPEVNDSWAGMLTVLDKEMPVKAKKDRRKWWIILLLLLLLGVCNAPVIWRLNKTGLQKKSAGSQSTNEQSLKNKTLPGAGSTKRIPHQHQYKSRQQISLPDMGKGKNGTFTAGDTSTAHEMKKETIKNGRKFARNAKNVPNGDAHGLPANSKKLIPGRPVIGRKIPAQQVHVHGRKARLVPARDSQPVAIKNKLDTSRQRTSDITRETIKSITDSTSAGAIMSLTDSARIPRIKIIHDTLDKVSPDLQQKDSSRTRNKKVLFHQNKHGFAVGIGLNQFFPIGEQQHSNYNSGGTSGVLSDYIPVPQLAYYLNNKLYIQMEMQFNTPQYTRQLLIKQVLSDSVPSGQRVQHSVFIKKLFYFNVPISVHYSPVKNFYIGAGVQFARLNNAVALLEEKQVSPNRPDSIKSAKVQDIKTDSVYQLLKTSEWRFLLDANYHWKGFIFGIRYNQALDHFINVPVSNTVITQARNNSLQLYLRYTLWRK